MRGRRMIQLMMVAALVVSIAPPAAAGPRAGGRQVTWGEFTTLPGGTELGYEIEGRAIMVRSPGREGHTRVALHLGGLDAHASYPVHVHNQPCSATPAGGSHYQHEVGGAADNVNEIWPVVKTNTTGNGVGRATHGHWARSDAMSIVVHYPANTSIRLACADLN